MKSDLFFETDNHIGVMDRIQKRIEERYEVKRPVYVTFYNRGRLYRGIMVDLSGSGVRLYCRAGVNGEMPQLSEGRSMECYIDSYTGRSKCRGSIRWQRCKDGFLTWGLSFIERSTEENDALRKLIEETCVSGEILPASGMAIY